MRASILILSALFLQMTALCQDEVTRFDAIISPWLINPAKAGLTDNILEIYAQRQWAGFSHAPTNFCLRINGRLAPFNFYTNRMLLNKTSYKSKGDVGIGASLMRDINGPFNYTELKLNYAYHIDMDKAILSLGLVTDLEISGIHENEMNPLVQDPIITGVKKSAAFFNPGFGASYQSKKYAAGISMNNIIENGIRLKDDKIEYFRNYRTFSVNGNYNFSPVSNLFVIPEITISSHDFNDLIYNIRSNFIYLDDYNCAFSYSSLNILFIHLGVKLKRVNISYGFSRPFSSISTYIYGSHEINIGLRFGEYVY